MYNIFYAIFAIPVGLFYDKIGRKRIITLGYFLFTITTFGFAYFKTLPALIVLFGFYGIVYALVEGNQRAFISDLATRKVRATALVFFYTTTGILTLISSLLAGFLWHHISPEATFIFGGCISFIAGILFFAFRNIFPKKV